MKLTADQRAALDALPPKRKAFVLHYVGESCGNATDAARRAGYKKPHPEGAQLLRNPTVAKAVELFMVPAESAKVMAVSELREMWSTWARDGEVGMRDRLKASELLGKSQGAFLERHEHSGPSGGALQVQLQVSPEQAIRVARESGEGGGSDVS